MVALYKQQVNIIVFYESNRSKPYRVNFFPVVPINVNTNFIVIFKGCNIIKACWETYAVPVTLARELF